MRRIICVFGLFFLVLSGFFSRGSSAAEISSLIRRLDAMEASSVTEAASLASLLKQSVLSYERLTDYRAMFDKQEMDEGRLGERESIFLKFEKPFKIYMHWLNTSKKGLQVLYERGRHDGKLAIHKPGLLLGLAPVIFLDRTSPWVREGSESYDIEDAGIGSFLYDFSEMVLKGSSDGIMDAAVKKESGKTRVDVKFPGSRDDAVYFAGRVEVDFDTTSSLPVQMTLYDWDNRVTGIYEYRQLAVDVGGEDPEFKKIAQKKLFRLYQPPGPITAPKSNFGTKHGK